MASKVIIELSVRDFKVLADFLEAHESDIGDCVNDYADLEPLFRAVFDMNPVGTPHNKIVEI